VHNIHAYTRNKPRIPLVLMLLLGAGAASGQPRIELDTDGGDSWTFAIEVTGHAAPRDCDAIAVESPAGRVNALRVGDRFYANVGLYGADNSVVAVCRQRGRDVARTPPQRWRVRVPDVPKARIRMSIVESKVRLDGSASERAPGRSAPIVRYEWRRARAGSEHVLKVGNEQLWYHESTVADCQEPCDLAKDPQIVSGERLNVTAPPANHGPDFADFYIELQVTDSLGRSDRTIGGFSLRDGRPRQFDLEPEHPQWVNEAVLYGAAPYFFMPRNFRGVTERLDEIAALGATAVWLSPVTAAPDDDFGYAVTDQFRLRERFGSEADLRALIERAHALGLKVMIDFVPNHLSQQSAYYRDTVAHGPRSPYYRWFDRDEHAEVTTHSDTGDLKNLNYDHPQVRAHTLAALSRFVRDYAVDGFRMHTSWAIAYRAPDFWPQVRTELKRINPDILLLAGSSARDPHPFRTGFDAAYDWTGTVGEWAWKDAFPGDARVDVRALRRALDNYYRGHDPDALILRFLNSADTGERFITRYGEPIAKLAATLVFTLPGIPLIYNGDETGAAFEPYDKGPPLQWNDTGSLALHYRRLAAMRHEDSALQSRKLCLLSTDQDQAVLAYLRPATRHSGPVLVLLNFSEQPVTARPADARTVAVFRRFSHSQELLSRKELHVAREPRLEPRSALVLRSFDDSYDDSGCGL
jgi:cyclomaltodextrinase / maltogenic alpha-amylase / neopullulanase